MYRIGIYFFGGGEGRKFQIFLGLLDMYDLVYFGKQLILSPSLRMKKKKGRTFPPGD